VYLYHHVYHPLSPSTEGPVGDWMNRVRQVGVSNFPLGGESNPLYNFHLRPITREKASSLVVWATLILGEKKNLN